MQFNTLIDTGSTHSFINLNKLPPEIQNEVKWLINNQSYGNNRSDSNVKTVTLKTINNQVNTLMMCRPESVLVDRQFLFICFGRPISSTKCVIFYHGMDLIVQ